MNWEDLKNQQAHAYEKATTKRGAFEIMQKKRTGKFATPGGTKGGLLDSDDSLLDEEDGLIEEEEDIFSGEESYDFSKSDAAPIGSGRGRQSSQRKHTGLSP